MMSLVSRAGLQRRLPWLDDWLRDERAAWVLVLRSLLTYYIAAWLAMRFELEKPSTTMITVTLLIHPQAGMVLAKSFYRTIGTFTGCLFALLLVALFPQQRVLFLLCLSLWVGLCAGGATLYRNFTAYGFVLSGYTAVIVILPVLSDPTTVFRSAVMRVSEVMLGIIVSGVISDTLWPMRMRAMLHASMRDQLTKLIDFVRKGANGKLARKDMEQAQLNFANAAVSLENLRASVIFEDAEVRARSPRMSLANHYYMAASTSFQSAYQLIDRMRRDGRDNVADALFALYRPVDAALADADPRQPAQLAQRLNEALSAMPAVATRLSDAFTDEGARIDFDTGADLWQCFTNELRQFVWAQAVMHEHGLRNRVERVRFRRGNDVVAAAVAMLRSSLTLVALASWWIISAWPSGTSAMLMAVIFTGLFATIPRPLSMVIHLWYGYVVGTLAAAVVTLVLLPLVDGYLLLIATTLPLLMVGPYLLAHPRSASIGLGYAVSYVSSMSLTNPMVYDPVFFINDNMAQLLGVALAGVSYIIIPSVTGSAWQRRRLATRLRRQVDTAARAPLRGLIARFESVNHDLLQQIAASIEPDSAESRHLLAWSLSVNESGRALIELRRRLAASSHAPPLRAATTAAILAMAALYDAPNAHRWRAADQAVNAACTLLIAADRDNDASHGLLTSLWLLHGALHDDKSPLAAFMPAPTTTTPAAPNAL